MKNGRLTDEPFHQDCLYYINNVESAYYILPLIKLNKIAKIRVFISATYFNCGASRKKFTRIS